MRFPVLLFFAAFLNAGPLTPLAASAVLQPPGAGGPVIRGATVTRNASGDGSRPEPAAPRAAALPSNLEVDLAFQTHVEGMWRSSPTFRSQCRRLAAAVSLEIRVLVDDHPRQSSAYNAQTKLARQAGALVSAEIYLRPSPDTAKHIAHELEHIIEQLDEVDLRAQVGNGVVWTSGDGTFETRRAIEAGLRVARDIAKDLPVSNAPAVSADRRARTLATIVQRDRDAQPGSSRSARISASGRHIVFTSLARLLPDDRNESPDVYVLDLTSGQVSLESAGRGAASANGGSHTADITSDGRYVVFESTAGNLAQTEFQPGTSQVFLRNRHEGTTRLLTSNAQGEPGNGTSRNPVISADGTTVVFESSATDLTDRHDASRRSFAIYLIRLPYGHPVRLDLAIGADTRAGQSTSPSVSADGQFVAFMSKANPTGFADIYLGETKTNTTVRISRGHGGGDPNGSSYHPAISGDGRYVVFVSEASNLLRDPTAPRAQILIHDRQTGAVELVSRTAGSRPANGPSAHPAISHDGSIITFQSLASDLLCNRKCRGAQSDINLLWDVFVYNRTTRGVIRASADDGMEWMENSHGPSLDESGCVITFSTRHPISTVDDAHDDDLYVMAGPGCTAGTRPNLPREDGSHRSWSTTK